MAPPYRDARTPEQMQTVTGKLLRRHPLTANEIRDCVLEAWDAVWKTTIGRDDAAITLKEIDPPATVVGYLLEKVIARSLQARYPKKWRGGTGSEKDLHCLVDEKFSIEMKSSGQFGLKIFGNRSYGQKLENDARAKKDKSGYYITVNFFEHTINLIRFGWIDADDWQAQKAASGQMSGLKPEVYRYKLVPLNGEYVLEAPLHVLDGIGPKSVDKLNKMGYWRIKDLLEKKAPPVPSKLFGKAKTAATEYGRELA